MDKKILEGLKKTYSNLGLPESVLSAHAKLLSGFIPADASDEDKEKKVNELVEGAKEHLTAIQSFGDARAAGKNKGGKGNKSNKQNTDDTTDDGDDDNGGSGNDSESMKLLKQILDNQKKYEERIATLENNNTKKDRDALVDGIAKELGLPETYLKYAKATLTDDMDEKALRDALGKAKKDFSAMGLHDDDDPATKANKEAAMRKEEETWLDNFVKSQGGNQ